MIFNISGPGVTIEKLWENASPTSDFGAQSISLNLAKYDGVIIYYSHYKNGTVERSMLCRKGVTSCLQSNFGSAALSGDEQIAIRNVSVEDSSLLFTSASVSNSGGSMTANDGCCIPLAFFGVKGVTE